MIDDAHKALSIELEATRVGLRHQVSHLQQDLTKLTAMVHGADEAFDAYQFNNWTQGNAVRTATEIASLLSRERTLLEAIHLLSKMQLSEEEK